MEDIKQMKRGKNLFIFEATFEYFIAIVIGGAYLAKVTSALGMSQGLTGILSAFVSLGHVFQLFALFFAGRRNVKSFVTVMHSINQVCFALIYLIPSMGIPKIVKHIAFIAFLLGGHVLSNLIHSPKIGWYMTFVEEKERGDFTAKKEIFSLFGGIIFSYLVSFVIDYYEAMGLLNVAFIISSVAIFILAVAHTFILIKTPEHDLPTLKGNNNFILATKTVFRNKRVLKVLIVVILYNLMTYMVSSFYGTYIASSKAEFGLGFSMSFIATISFIGSAVRMIFSFPMGRFADKYSFKTMAILCYAIFGVAFAVNAFTNPLNGKVMYVIYIVVHSIAMAGANSCVINLLYEEVKPELRMSAYAVQNAVAGLIGFLGAIVAGIFVDKVQTNPNGMLLGLYAQQWLSIFGVFLAVVLVFYVTLCLKKKKNEENEQNLLGTDVEEVEQQAQNKNDSDVY